MKGHSIVEHVEHEKESIEDGVERLMPFNHHLRGLYRGFLGILAVGIMTFSAVGLAKSWGDPFFGSTRTELLGAPINPVSAVFWLIIGSALLVAVLIGRNVLSVTATAIGSFLLGVGIVLLGVARTYANVFAYTVGNTFITFAIALIVLWCGMFCWELHHNDKDHQAPTHEQLPSETGALVKVSHNRGNSEQ